MTLSDLLESVRAYWPTVEDGLLRQAHDFAAHAHAGQRRLTGDPFIAHPLEVAGILTTIESDPEAVAAALLHDVLEDTGVALPELAEAFGRTIADLVEGVTNLTRLDFRSRQEAQAENFRRMFLAMAKDIRVIVIKIADRLHNMRTLDVFDDDKRREIALETLHIFAPLSHRLGVWTLKWELEDRCFRYLEPEAYADIVAKVNRTRGQRENEIQQAIAILQSRLASAGIQPDIQGRPKHLYSIYQKMLREGVDFDEIYDLTALRLLCDSVADCYAALGIVHELWMPIPDMFTDYLAKPKANKYQSLHTKVLGPHGERMEVQIRTREMHRVAEYGVAAHWRYKEGGRESKEDAQLSWLRQLLDLESDFRESHEYLSSLKMELFRDEVFVFTPKGDVVDLPVGATPVDFAYRIHTEVGHRCVGAKVNGRMVPLDYALRNGDIAEIITAKSARPSPDWLRITRTSSAKSKIRRFLRQQLREENVARGRDLLDRELSRLSAREAAALRAALEDQLAEIAPDLHLRAAEDVLAAIGYGDLDAEHVFQHLRPRRPPQTLADEAELLLPMGEAPPPAARASVTADGVSGLQTKLSKCCAPLPGDRIVGYVTRGRGLTVHRADCKNLEAHARREPHRVVPLDWGGDGGGAFPTELFVDAIDRVGLLSDITAIISETQINITAANLNTNPQDRVAQLHLTLDIRRREDLDHLIRRLQGLSDVIRVRSPARRP